MTALGDVTLSTTETVVGGGVSDMVVVVFGGTAGEAVAAPWTVGKVVDGVEVLTAGTSGCCS